MKLTDEEVTEFAELWKQAFGESLPPDEARIEAGRLLELYAMLTKPTEPQHS